MSHKIPTTLLPSEGATQFIIYTDAGSVSVSGSVALLGAGSITTSATGTSVFVTGTGGTTSLTIHTPSGDASPSVGTLYFTTPPVSGQFISTLATDNTLYFISEIVPVSAGGTGQTVLPINHLIYGQGSNPPGFIPPGTNGQTLIGATGTFPIFATITSSRGSLMLTQGPYSLDLEVNAAVFSFTGTLPVAQGGTGQTSLTTHSVLVGEGSLPIRAIPPGTDGQTLIAATGLDPLFATISSPGGTITFGFGPNALNLDINFSLNSFFNPWPVNRGGTGNTLLTFYSVLIGEGSLDINTSNQGTNGQALIGATNADPQFTPITSTGGSIFFTQGPHSLNLDVTLSAQTFSSPLPINNGSTGRSVLTTYGVLIGEGSLPVNVSDPGTDGQVFLASSIGDPAFATISSTGGTLTFTYGHNSLNIEINTNSSFFQPFPVSLGGTGLTVMTTYGVLVGEGSLPIQAIPPGTDGQALLGSSIGDPLFATITSTGGTLTFTYGHNSLNLDIRFSGTWFNPLIVPSGGTGLTVLTSYTVLIGEGSLGIHTSNVGTNGQALIAATGADPAFASITSTGNTVFFTKGPNSLNLEVNFAGLTAFSPIPVSKGSLGQVGFTMFGVLIGEGSFGVHVTDPGTNGQTLVGATGQDPAFTTITSNIGMITVTKGTNSLNLDVGNSSGLFVQADEGSAFPLSEQLFTLGQDSVSTTGTGSTIAIQVDLSSGSFFNPLPPGTGSTGLTILTLYGVLLGEGSNNIHVTAAGTNGQTLIAFTTGDPQFSTMTSTGGSIGFVAAANSLNLDVRWSKTTFFIVTPINNGGTGQSILTAHGVLIGEGSNSIHVTAAGTNGQVLLASTMADPAFATLSSSAGTLSFALGANTLNINVNWNAVFNPLPIPYGGTGQTVLTTFGVLIGEGSNTIHVTAAGTNGQILLASSSGDPAFATLTSSGLSLTFSRGVNSLNIETYRLSSLSFFNPLPVSNGGTGLTVLTTFGVLIGEGSNNIHVSAAGTSGQLLLASSIGDPKFATLTSSGRTLTFQGGIDSLNLDWNWKSFSFFNPIQVISGGTGRTILTTHGVLIGEGSNPIDVTAAGTNGQILLASSSGDPKFATLTSSGRSLTFQWGPNSLNMEMIINGKTFFNPLIVPNGGTGRTILTAHGVLIGEGSRPINVTAAGTNGQVLLAATGADPKFSTLSSTGRSITFSFGPNSLNLDLNLNNTYLNPWPVVQGGTSNQSEAAYAVICGGTASTSALQSVVPLGTSGYVLTSNGPNALPSFRGTGITQINIQTFSSSGTYFPSAGMQFCTVECVAGGGGSGGVNTGDVTLASAGGGGGGYAKKTFPAVTVGASQTVTVGSGGLGGANNGANGASGGGTSFGALLTTTGGRGGVGAPSNPSGLMTSAGGAGGVGNLGDLNVAGQYGSNGWAEIDYGNFEYDVVYGGAGGCSHFGGGGVSGAFSFPHASTASFSSLGQNGQAIGGGAGGHAAANLNVGLIGKTGANGAVIISEYI